MNEMLLQYIWKFKLYNPGELTTQDGEPIRILSAGNLNRDQGPDFLDGKIQLGETIWAGHIELHINASDWNIHQHSKDDNYKNVILHVVWFDDVALDQPFPVLELQSRVSKLLLGKYTELMQSDQFLPCQKNIGGVDALTWRNWKERLLVERLVDKSSQVLTFLQQTNQHWEEVFWWMLGRNFGIKVNSETFEQIARSLPTALLSKHKNQVQQLECLLFGQAGLLTGRWKDPYMIMLQKEYRFLQKKYGLKPVNMPLHFLRMRPANFPTVRLAQLAMLVHHSMHLFSKILETFDVKKLLQLFNVTANDYWHYHYIPAETAPFKEKKLGHQMTENILINTILPVLFAYGRHKKEQLYTDRAMQWLEQIPAEDNRVTREFSTIGVAVKNAFDSQAVLQLRNEYCNNKKCLECAIGNRILKTRNQVKF